MKNPLYENGLALMESINMQTGYPPPPSQAPAPAPAQQYAQPPGQYQQPAPAPAQQYAQPPGQYQAQRPGGGSFVDPEMASVFAQIAAGNPSGGRANLIDGNYTLIIKKIIAAKFTDFPCFVVEFYVLESTANMQGVIPYAPGTEFGWAVKFGGPAAKSAAGNVLAFLMAVYNLQLNQLDRSKLGDDLAYVSRDYDPATGQGQPLIGRIIRCNTYRKPKKSKPDEIMTLPGWVHVQQDQADWGARRSHILAGGDGRMGAIVPAVAQPAPAPAQQYAQPPGQYQQPGR